MCPALNRLASQPVKGELSLKARERISVLACWGNAAIKKVTSAVDENKYFVITTSHDSPLGATKTSSPFLDQDVSVDAMSFWMKIAWRIM